MDFLGTIEPTAGASTGRSDWITLIGTHPALAAVQPRQGISPLMKAPMQYRAPPDSALVLVSGSELGSITWAEDDSQVLVAWSNVGAESQVATVAADVAARLGWQFLPLRAA